MEGIYQVGDELKAIMGPYAHGIGGVVERVGERRVTAIVVEKAAGPMGFYAVAQVFRDGDLAAIHALHLMETVEI